LRWLCYPENIGVAVGILLLGGVELKISLGIIIAPVHWERDFNSVHGTKVKRCLGPFCPIAFLPTHAQNDHFSTSGQFLKLKGQYEIPMGHFLFNYEIWWRVWKIYVFWSETQFC